MSRAYPDFVHRIREALHSHHGLVAVARAFSTPAVSGVRATHVDRVALVRLRRFDGSASTERVASVARDLHDAGPDNDLTDDPGVVAPGLHDLDGACRVPGRQDRTHSDAEVEH